MPSTGRLCDIVTSRFYGSTESNEVTQADARSVRAFRRTSVKFVKTRECLRTCKGLIFVREMKTILIYSTFEGID